MDETERIHVGVLCQMLNRLGLDPVLIHAANHEHRGRGHFSDVRSPDLGAFVDVDHTTGQGVGAIQFAQGLEELLFRWIRPFGGRGGEAVKVI